MQTPDEAWAAITVHLAQKHGRDEAQAVLNLARNVAMAEREANARIASGMSDGMDCDDRGAQDPETGEVPCAAEARGEVCVCSARYELAFKIADKIRARSTTTV